MFGLEKDTKQVFKFDLELAVQDPSIMAEKLAWCMARQGEIKRLLRSGVSKEDYDRLGCMLQGYAALHRVLARLAEKEKQKKKPAKKRS